MRVSMAALSYTVEPVYNGHPRDLRNWPLNAGALKLLTGRGLMSILMAYHTKTLHARKQKENQHSLKRSTGFKQSSVPTCNLTV